jgi:hypothetical protein
MIKTKKRNKPTQEDAQGNSDNKISQSKTTQGKAQSMGEDWAGFWNHS